MSRHSFPLLAAALILSGMSAYRAEAAQAPTPGATVLPPGETPPPPPGTERVVNFDRHGNRIVVCAQKGGAPIQSGARNIPPTEVWYTDGQSVRKTAMPLGTCDPAWSPDGQGLAVIGPDGLWVLSNVFADQQDSGERLLEARSVMPPAVGTSGRSTTSSDVTLSKPAWSPDGSRIAVMATSGGSSWVEIVEVATGKRVFSSEPGVRIFKWGPDSHSLTIDGKTVRVPQ